MWRQAIMVFPLETADMSFRVYVKQRDSSFVRGFFSQIVFPPTANPLGVDLLVCQVQMKTKHFPEV